MAIYHLSMGHVSRSTGRSSVQAVAYICREKLFEERRGITADYRSKDEEVFWETLAPEGSGIGKKDLSIWNKLENFEDTIADKKFTDLAAREKYKSTARVSHTYVYALPKELTNEQNTELVRSIVEERFVARGLVVTTGYHFEEGNPHVHLIVSNRAVEGNIEKDGTFSRFKIARELFTRQELVNTRKLFADKANILFKSLGMSERIDHRSHEELQNGLIPTQHKGYNAHQLERDGHYSRLADENARILEENKQRIAEFPELMLKELTSTQATFSELDVIRLAQKRMKDDPSFLTEHVIGTVMKQAVEVGTGISNLKRYTTQDYFDKETRVLELLEDIGREKTSLKVDPTTVEAAITRFEDQAQETGFTPNEGQINGIKTLCGDAQLSVLIGRAGTGKTTTLRSVVELHQEAGYDVWGMAPSATAANQLEADTNCKSDTIAHYAYYWKKYEDALDLLHAATTDKEAQAAQKDIEKYGTYMPKSNTLIIVDEGGMVGVGDRKGPIPGGWDAITKVVSSTGAKLIISQDDHQFKPVEAGDIGRRLVHDLKGTNQLCELTEIKRQNIPWMREASEQLAELNVASALGAYENKGHLQSYSSNGDVYEAIAQQYLRNMIREPDSKGIVIAATNEERVALNREIRSLLKQHDLLSKEDTLQLGEDGFCIGDRIIFTKNDRGWNTSFSFKKEGVYVQNNMRAVIQSITPCVVVDQNTGEIQKTTKIVAHVPQHDGTVEFTLNKFRDFAHSYAVTGYKSQGATLDWSLVKLSRYMDAHALYVNLTRHREEVSIYYSNDDFKDYNALVSSLSRANVKDLVIDYSISDENKEYWLNVQDYKEMGRELTAIRMHINKLDPENREARKAAWEEHRFAEADRKSMAKFILEDWEIHKDFVRQGGLTREGIEIAAGLKKRTLSRVELQAQVTVEQYVAASLEARQLWRDIRRTHPGIRAKSHPEWQQFEDARNHRGVLANQIYLNPILYRPFLKEAAQSLAKADVGYVTKDQKVSYSMATIKAQAEAYQSKMLQQELLKDDTKPAQQSLLKVLIDYTEHRDMAGRIWQEVKPKLKNFEGTLLQESFSKALTEYREVSIQRDATALEIMTKEQDFVDLAERVGIKLDLGRLKDQAAQGIRNNLLQTYQSHPDQMTKLEAAHKIHEMVKGEAELEKKPTLSFIYQQGLAPKAIAQDALEYQKTKLFESLKVGLEKGLFLLLDEYGAHCRKANDLYSQCIREVEGKEGLRPWHSSHYGAYKATLESRNQVALEVFDQRDHNHVLTMAEQMGIRFKDVELAEIFSRCEQATRTRHIAGYLKAETPEAKGEAAVALRQMITFERRENNTPSKTAQQAFYAGIDFNALQTTAFEHGRARVFKGLTSAKEVGVYHALEAYEAVLNPANKTYKACLDESKEKAIKPWETKAFKEYISLVTVQDEKAYQLIKDYDAPSVAKVAKEMGVSVKKLDVEAHRHSLRQTLQTFTGGDRTNVPMAAKEVLNWIEFDRHSDHKHTFKVLREQGLWPKNLEDSLKEFFHKKKELRHESERDSRGVGQAETAAHQGYRQDLSYKILTYERQLSFAEIDQQLKSRMVELSTQLIGNPTSKTFTQLRFGRKGSICVFTGGAKQGLYANHETGTYGGPLKLIEEQAGLSSAREAKDWATDWLGGKAIVIEQKIIEKTTESKHTTWTPITPVPKEVENPDIAGNKYLNFMLKDGNQEVARYAYRDEQGRLKGYVFRFERANSDNPNGKSPKITPPLAYCQNEKDFRAWRWQAFEKENKTPYGIEKLAQDAAKPILIVEGEKACDAAQKLLPEYHVLTWGGGVGNVGKTDWQCVAGKDVVIWPDNDAGGFKAADTLQKIVISLNAEQGLKGTVGVVSLPETLPEKWDLADTLPEGWSVDTVKERVKSTINPAQLAIEIDNKHSEPRAEEIKITTDQAVQQFIGLCEFYESLHWTDPRNKQAMDDIEKFAANHMTNQEFVNKVMNSENNIAIERLEFEMGEQRDLLVEAFLKPQEPGAILDPSRPELSAEKAAQHFIDLCALYETLTWNDPRDKPTLREIEAVAGKYMHNKEFREHIENSKNEVAIERLHIEIEEKLSVSQSLSRGI